MISVSSVTWRRSRGICCAPGSVFAFLAAHRRELFPDELFADLFASGRVARRVPADVVATVIVLQTLHGLSDREAAEAVTFDLRWKAACRAWRWPRPRSIRRR